LASCGAACLTLYGVGTALAQTPAPAPTPAPAVAPAAPATPTESGVTALPQIEVVAPRRAQPPRPPKTRVITAQRRETPAAPPQTEAQAVAGHRRADRRQFLRG
jgi:hypothetical protein